MAKQKMQPVLHPWVFQHCLHQSDLNGLERVSNNLNKAFSQIKFQDRNVLPSQTAGPGAAHYPWLQPLAPRGAQQMLSPCAGHPQHSCKAPQLTKEPSFSRNPVPCLLLASVRHKTNRKYFPYLLYFLTSHPNAPHRLEIQNTCGMHV